MRFPALRVDVDAFMTPAFDIPQAVEAIGKVRRQIAYGEYTQMHFAPPRGIEDAYLETRNDELLGIRLRFAAPVTVDLEAVSAVWAPGQPLPSAPDSFQPGALTFNLVGTGLLGVLELSAREWHPGRRACLVHELHARRWRAQPVPPLPPLPPFPPRRGPP